MFRGSKVNAVRASSSAFPNACLISVWSSIFQAFFDSCTNTSPIVSFNIEVTENTIIFTYTQAALFDTASFNCYIFTAISPGIPPFGSITVDLATTLAGFNSSDLSLDSKHFNVNVSGLEAFSGTVLKLDVAPAVSSVPEPSSLVLIGLGLLVIGGVYTARRRRAKRT
jgi:PEP-CTERM motif